MCEPIPEEGSTVPTTPEPKHLRASDQGCELASPVITMGILVKFEGMEASQAHPPAIQKCVSSSVLLAPPSLPLPPPLQTAIRNALYSLPQSSANPTTQCQHPPSVPQCLL